MKTLEIIAIVLVILGFITFIYALMNTAYKADEEAEQLYMRKFDNNESREQ